METPPTVRPIIPGPTEPPPAPPIAPNISTVTTVPNVQPLPMPVNMNIGGSTSTVRRGRGVRTATGSLSSLNAPSNPLVNALSNPLPSGTTGQNVILGSNSLAISVTNEQKRELMARAARIEENLPQLMIETSLLTIFSLEEIEALRVCDVTQTADPLAEGYIDDPRMGIIEPNRLCNTCHKDNMRCHGHLGLIRLNVPFIHPLFLRETILVLMSVCNSCGRLLLPKSELDKRGLLRKSGVSRLQAIAKASENVPCLHRHNQPGVTPCIENPKFFPAQLKKTDQILYQPQGSTEDPKPMRTEDIIKILNAIPDESPDPDTPSDAELLGFMNGAHPRRMRLLGLPVTSPRARPPAHINGEVIKNPMTEMYEKIVNLNNTLTKPLDADRRLNTIKQLYNLIRHLIDNSDGKYKARRGDFKGYKQLSQGKDGLVRAMMQGKRVDYSARTVITPNPSLKFGQVSIPRIWAPILTKKEVVTEWNAEAMTKLLREGHISRFVPVSGKGQGISIRVEEKYKNWPLKKGDIVHRWLQDGDYVVINRQPTLHKYSMMGGEVVLWDETTIGVHLSYSTPFNLDFELNA